MQGDWGTIGGRLRWAIQRRPRDGRKRGVRKFQSDLEERSRGEVEAGQPAIPGVTMPSIQGYLKDEVKPSLHFLEQSADLCEVDEDWLITGRGYPTEDQARAANTVAATVSAQIKLGDMFTQTGSEPGLALLHRRVFKKLKRPMTDRPPPWLASLIEVWLQLSESGKKDRKSLKTADRALAERRAKSIAHTLALATLTGDDLRTITLGGVFTAYRQHRVPRLKPYRQGYARTLIPHVH